MVTCEYMLEVFLGRIVKKMGKVAISGEENWVSRGPGLGGKITLLQPFDVLKTHLHVFSKRIKSEDTTRLSKCLQGSHASH